MRYSLFNAELMIRKCLMRVHLVIRLLPSIQKCIIGRLLSIKVRTLQAFRKYCDDPRLTDRNIPTKQHCTLTHFSIDVATKGHCLRN